MKIILTLSDIVCLLAIAIILIYIGYYWLKWIADNLIKHFKKEGKQ